MNTKGGDKKIMVVHVVDLLILFISGKINCKFLLH